MIRYIVGGLAFLLAVVSTSADDKKEATELEGTWVVTSLKVDGKQPPDLDLAKTKLEYVISKEKIQIKRGGNEVNDFKYKADPKKDPKQLDYLAIDLGNDKQGIYKIEGDTLTIASGLGENARPKDFTGKGEKVSLIVAVRKKDKK